MKAPFSWPKSSFSSRASGIAAQLMATKGALARAESWWSGARHQLLARAALPEDQDRGVAARPPVWIASIVSFRAGSSPSTRGRPNRRWYSSFSSTYSVRRRRRSIARSRSSRRWSVSTGFVRKSAAPVLHGLDGLLDGPEGRHHDDGRLRVGLERGLEHVEAAAGGEPQVGQHDEEARALEPPAGLVGVSGLVDAPAARLQGLAQHRRAAIPCLRRSGCRPRNKMIGAGGRVR